MVDSADFDGFYADARDRLLHQCYALTGDLPASQAAVRDAFVAAWHHWRKVARTGDPERWARPVAWAHAHRRSGARVFHRDRSDDPDIAATLEALGKLSFVQRRVLVLSTLTRNSLEELAREAGLTREAAERELQTATATFTLHRGAEPGMVRLYLDRLRQRLGDVTWPRVTIVRRQGTARRRGYTLAGVAAVVALVIGSGAAVGYDGHAHPTLAHEKEALVPTPVLRSEAPPPPPELDADDLLAADQLKRLAPAVHWRVAGTTKNLDGDGLVLPCQQSRFADPQATGALVRSYSPARKRSPYEAFQLTELSRTAQVAKRTFQTSVGWYAGCPADRVQLVSTRAVDGVGDQATLLVLRGWARPASTMVVGVARTGQVTTTVLSDGPGNGRLSPQAVSARASLLAAAVNGLCGSPGAGTCASPPTLRVRPPYPVGLVPGMLSGVDLPPVTGVDSSWVGTDPKKALVNTAATQCDGTDFNGRPFGDAWTRTFLFPEEKLPDTFGLTETVGTTSPKAGAAFVEALRKRMSSCEDRNLGTKVTKVADRRTSDGELAVWRVAAEVSDQRTVTYQMGIVRSGSAIAQVGFTPTQGVTMSAGDFLALVERAQQRLPALPKPGKTASGG
ncbi:RNA polymerase sigma factor [Nocardioides sp.]|uniref:RNA polymerase sigma factor n=1 Tax=Nocardioides sp. TaxID=35761 RepID=UPI003528A707